MLPPVWSIMSKVEAKKRLREKLREDMVALSLEYIAKSDAAIFEKLVSMPEFESAKTIFTYLSVDREVDTRRFIEYAITQGKTILLPILRGKEMTAAAVTDLSTLVKGVLGIPRPPEGLPETDPSSADLIIVPAMAYDRLGMRLGRGGGFYDRLLNRCSAVSVGLAREKLVLDELVTEEHDMGVDILVTEKVIARIQ